MSLRPLAFLLGALALATALPAAPLDSTGEPSADAILADWLNALGRPDDLGKIRSITISEVIDDGQHPVQTLVTLGGQGNFRLESVDRGHTLVQAFDGKTAWRQSDSLGFGFLPPIDLRTILFQQNPLIGALLKGHYGHVIVLPDTDIGGKTCHEYLFGSDTSLDERWTVEKDTGLVRIIATPGAPGSPVIRFDDYRPVPPMNFPFKTTITTAEKTLTITRSSVELGSMPLPSFFSANTWDVRDEQKIEEVLNRYIAKSGADPSEFVRTRQVVSKIDTPATGVTSTKTVTLTTRPAKILIDTRTTGMGDMVEGFNGDVGWELTDLQGFRLLKPNEVPQLFANVVSEVDRHLPDEAPLRHLVGERMVAGRRATAVALSSLSSPIGIFYFDDEDGRLIRVGSTKQRGMSAVPEATIDYSDFHMVDGVDTAFTTTMTTATVQVITTIETIKNNVPVDEAIFDPKSGE